MRRLPLVVVPMILALVLAACGQTASQAPASNRSAGTPTDATETSAPTDGASPSVATAGTVAEPNVVAGSVTTMQGEPIEDARLRIVGYTGGANLGQEIETVLSGSDGRYRYEVPRGLYEVLGEANIDFEGQSYLFQLEPVDGACDQAMSDEGIIEDFVLVLTGLRTCVTEADSENYAMYHGAAIQLFSQLTEDHDPAAVVEYTLEPTGPLADGSTGETITMERTIVAHESSTGRIEDTWILHDIPLAMYHVTATLIEGGDRVPLLVSTGMEGTPSSEAEVRFEARSFLGGYTVPNVTIYEPELG